MVDERFARRRALALSLGATAVTVAVGVGVSVGVGVGPTLGASPAPSSATQVQPRVLTPPPAATSLVSPATDRPTDALPVSDWPPVASGPPIERVAEGEPGRVRTAKALARAAIRQALASLREGATPEASPDPTPQPVPVRMVQANIKVSQPAAAFAADLAKVLTGGPDFITLNEAHSRSYAQITPPGYASYRGMDSPYTRETPVLWRTDRWEELAVGTRYLTTRRVKWGVRAVNWVRVRNIGTGQVLTVISAHPAPTNRATAGLLPVFASRLAGLVHQVDDQGPVLVGGDFNAGYRGRLYPGAAFASAGLSPTYAQFGAPVGGTGDHGGATIDFVLYQSGRDLTPQRQGTYELQSDHDAVWVDFLLAPPTT